jgi:hypothetical protein
VLHHLRLLTYTPTPFCALKGYEEFASGTREGFAIWAASIIAVQRVAAALCADGSSSAVSSLHIDFFLWGLAKSLEVG